MENKKEQILNKIREANPELMKLEFGCNVKLKKPFMYEDGLSPYIYTRIIDYIPVDNRYFLDGVDKILEVKEDDIDIILGKDPTLSDLLLTIGDKLSAIQFPKEKNLIAIWDKETNLAYYDLTKSLIQNLENEELVDFIYSIICKEE